MKKILLSTIAISSIAFASSVAQIDAKKVELEALKLEIKTLEASNPEYIAKKKAEALKAKTIKTHVEVGYTNTKGNSDTQTVAIDATIEKIWDTNTFKASLDADYADYTEKDTDIETKNKYLTEMEYTRTIHKALCFDYLAGYKFDKFSSLDYSFYTGPGLKYKAIETAKHKLTLGVNILYTQDKDRATEEKTDYTSALIRGEYNWQIIDNLRFAQEVSYRSDVEDREVYYVLSKSALYTKLTDMFSLSVSYKVDYVNKAIISDRADRTFGVNIVVDF